MCKTSVENTSSVKAEFIPLLLIEERSRALRMNYTVQAGTLGKHPKWRIGNNEKTKTSWSITLKCDCNVNKRRL